MRKAVNGLWWLRWKTLLNARASRQAHEMANKPDTKWAELPPEVLRAMEWAAEEEATEGE